MLRRTPHSLRSRRDNTVRVCYEPHRKQKTYRTYVLRVGPHTRSTHDNKNRDGEHRIRRPCVDSCNVEDHCTDTAHRPYHGWACATDPDPPGMTEEGGVDARLLCFTRMDCVRGCLFPSIVHACRARDLTEDHQQQEPCAWKASLCRRQARPLLYDVQTRRIPVRWPEWLSKLQNPEQRDQRKCGC